MTLARAVLKGDGLSADAIEICDSFVHIPHCEGSFVSSLDTTVAISIVLHHFGTWANFKPREFKDSSTCGKFVLDELAFITERPPEADAIAANRERERAAIAAADNMSGGNIFAADY